MTTTTFTATAGHDLRATRERLGLTRARLANLTGCSFAQLSNIEQGAVPKRSRVLDEALAVLRGLETHEAGADNADPAIKTSVQALGHDEG